MARVFIIHGWEGRPDSNWLPWLKSELEKRGYEAITPAMPNTYEPKCKEWIAHLNGIIGIPKESDYIVGHSLGGITILRYLEQLKKGQKIGGAILVSGFAIDLGIKEHHGFFDTPVDWESIKSHCDNFVAINSDNDRYVPMSQARFLEEKLGARLIVKHNMGHITKTEMPDALEAIIEFSKSQD